MGLCLSNEKLTAEEKKAKDLEAATSKKLGNELNKAQQEDNKFLKLLLLGAGESGKSTLFKQMKVLQSEMTQEERLVFKQVIHANTIGAMQDLMAGIAHVERKKGLTITVKCTEAMAKIKELFDTDWIVPELAPVFKEIWEDEGIQVAYANRSCFHLIDSAAYFFSRIWDEDPITNSDFIPTENDVMRARVRTTGILDMTFEYETNTFRVFDVGGQRNERKKWIHCFEGVTAVLFVGVLSEYDLQLFEEEKVNRMVETLTLFRGVCNEPWFRDTEIILFLNKRDLFETKIQTVPLTVCSEIWREDAVSCRIRDMNEENPDPDKEWVAIGDAGFYTEPSLFEAGCVRIREQFYDQLDNPGSRQEYCHLTSAIDKDNFRIVFEEVKEIVVKQGLARAGLLG